MAIAEATLELLVQMKDEASDVASGIGSSLMSVGTIAGGVALAGVAAFGAALASGVGDAREAAQINAQTAAVIKSTGNAAGTSAEHIQDYAASLSAASGASLFGDSQVQEAENLLLTFTEIKGTTLDAATAISVDMAQALGGEPKAQAIALGKALNDPIKGVTALSRVGVSFTEQQKEQIKTLQESGQVSQAQAIILAELNKEFGGSAKAAADADGGWAQFNDRMGEAKETLGAAVLPLLTTLAGVLNTTVMPIIEQGAVVFGDLVAAFDEAGDPILGLGAAINTLLNSVFGMNTAIGFTVTDTITSLIDGFWAVAGVLQAQLMPILSDLADAVMPALGAAVQIAAAFWSDVLLPALNTLWQVLTTVVLPAVAMLAAWLKENLPPAIAAVSSFLTGTLFPALHKAFDFIQANVIPILIDVVHWLAENIPPAIAAASDFIQNTLIPALQNAYDYFKTNILPVIMEVVKWLQDNIPPAIAAAADFIQNTLIPALQNAYDYFKTNILPVLIDVAMWLKDNIPPAIAAVADFIMNTLIPALMRAYAFFNENILPILNAVFGVAFALARKEIEILAALWTGTLWPALQKGWEILQKLADVAGTILAPTIANLSTQFDNFKKGFDALGITVQSVVTFLNNLATSITNIKIPSWLQGHSPPPMANWLTDIADAADAATSAAGDLGFGGGGAPGMALAGGSSNTTITVGQIVVQGATDPQATALVVRNELIKLGQRNLDIFGGLA